MIGTRRRRHVFCDCKFDYSPQKRSTRYVLSVVCLVLSAVNAQDCDPLPTFPAGAIAGDTNGCIANQVLASHASCNLKCDSTNQNFLPGTGTFACVDFSYVVITESGTFDPSDHGLPSTVNVNVLVVGGGAGGAGGHQGGGGSGEIESSTITIGGPVTVTVGVGGDGSITSTSNSEACPSDFGGTSRFGNLLEASGGRSVVVPGSSGQWGPCVNKEATNRGGSGGGGACNAGSPGGNGGSNGGPGSSCSYDGGPGQGSNHWGQTFNRLQVVALSAGHGGAGGVSSHAGGGGGGGVLIDGNGPTADDGEMPTNLVNGKRGGNGGVGYGAGGGGGGYDSGSQFQNNRWAGGRGADGVVVVEFPIPSNVPYTAFQCQPTCNPLGTLADTGMEAGNSNGCASNQKLGVGQSCSIRCASNAAVNAGSTGTYQCSAANTDATTSLQCSTRCSALDLSGNGLRGSNSGDNGACQEGALIALGDNACDVECIHPLHSGVGQVTCDASGDEPTISITCPNSCGSVDCTSSNLRYKGQPHMLADVYDANAFCDALEVSCDLGSGTCTESNCCRALHACDQLTTSACSEEWSVICEHRCQTNPAGICARFESLAPRQSPADYVVPEPLVCGS